MGLGLLLLVDSPVLDWHEKSSWENQLQHKEEKFRLRYVLLASIDTAEFIIGMTSVCAVLSAVWFHC